MNYDWLNNKTPRSVDQLRLWADNPRLNPEESHIYLSDFVDEMAPEGPDRKDFISLMSSIVTNGFVPADPIIVWKSVENDKFYVAEGNRRILALKLLRNPEKAPKSIRGAVRRLSEQIDKDSIEKVYVNVAPNFDDAEWYINQRNSNTSLHKPWSRTQQLRWIVGLYEKYKGDSEKISSLTNLSQGEFESFIRILKIRELVKEPIVTDYLTASEYEEAISIKFPISILERFFSSAIVKEKWGMSFNGADIQFINREGFLNAFKVLIKDIVCKNPDNKIDTRTVTTDLEAILGRLPAVDLNITEDDVKDGEIPEHQDASSASTETRPDQAEDPNEPKAAIPTPSKTMKGNRDRKHLVLKIYEIDTDSSRINFLFKELQQIPFRYENCIASSIRVFLDLSVAKYFETENLQKEYASKTNKAYDQATLANKLEFLKAHILKGKDKKIVEKLLTHSNEFSLDVLNGFVHSHDSPYLYKNFLNGFWDFLFPLLQKLVDIKEKK